jgi:hypothetical protein
MMNATSGGSHSQVVTPEMGKVAIKEFMAYARIVPAPRTSATAPPGWRNWLKIRKPFPG